ncbi:uncharacterized protein CCOS01_16940 [Colletotrichum costaricense]|uniref:Uncharacterized protein n=1 Tax=Colletotrichum costaricense TaxID=1209916 RepID=A0AAJ0DRH6_9PEZI|nr:uncharacterized protein CCOS01_16940 [Colletotrichum costaricense]KAK1503865.1 hypothetical protein CCOS01_16940 [Colletotrichum costaricense]
MACLLFNICLSLFLEQKSHVGRVVALDEAHKYLGQSGESQVLTESLLQTVRLQRHLGVRMFISTQEPTISPRLLDLCTVTIVHRFSSPDWLRILRRHLANEDATPVEEASSATPGQTRAVTDLFPRITALRTGHSLVFAPTALIGRSRDAGGSADGFCRNAIPPLENLNGWDTLRCCLALSPSDGSLCWAGDTLPGLAARTVPCSQGPHCGCLALPSRLFRCDERRYALAHAKQVALVPARHIALRLFVAFEPSMLQREHRTRFASAISGTSRSQLKLTCSLQQIGVNAAVLSGLSNSTVVEQSADDSVSTALSSFATERTYGLLPQFSSWHVFRYKTLSIADCLYLVRGFKSGFLLALAEAAPDIATLVGLKCKSDYDAARRDVDDLGQILDLLANQQEPQRKHLVPAMGPAALSRVLQPTSKHGATNSAGAPRQFCVGNAIASQNTWGLDVEIVPTTHARHRTKWLAEIDAEIAVVCNVDGNPWKWEGAGKDFPAAWRGFVADNKVSQEAIDRLSVHVVAPPPSKEEARVVKDGQLWMASIDANAVSQVAVAFGFRHEAQDSTHQEPRLSDLEIRQRRLAWLDQ